MVVFVGGVTLTAIPPKVGRRHARTGTPAVPGGEHWKVRKTLRLANMAQWPGIVAAIAVFSAVGKEDLRHTPP
jgi:hypothetical protein